MATPIAVDFNGVSNALRLSLDNWGRTNLKYSALFKTLTPPIIAIAHAGLDEMPFVKPGGWEVWWAKEHNRFIRLPDVKQRELLLLHEIMHQYLSALARGQLGNGKDGIDSKPAKKKAKN